MVKASPDTMRMTNRPRLLTLEPMTSDRHASWLELFFDLVFVLAVTRTARLLSEHTDLIGLLKYGAVFIAVWWLWIGFTFYADRFETQSAVHRILMFAGMLTVAGLSVTLGGAFTVEGDAPFVVCYMLVLLVLIVLYARAAYHIPLARTFSLQYPIGLGISSLILLASLVIQTPLRYAVWAFVLLLEFLTPVLNIKAARSLPIDRSHIPERFGLFTIIVLGEAVIATASGAAEVAWNPSTIATACIGFAMAAAIWWITFDFVEDSALRSNSLAQRFVYLFGHFFAVTSIVTIGIGVEHAIKETEAGLGFSTIVLLTGGTVVYLSSITVTRLITGVCNLVYPRVIAITLLLALTFVGSYLPSLVVMSLVLLLLSAEVWIENYYAEDQQEDDADRLSPCEHAGQMTVFNARTHDGCEECRKNNYKWVHLRLCLSCGHVGCCDTSVNKHATKHFHALGHPIMASLEKDESWAWCYVDERFVPIDRPVQP
jgi:low temperature requirement protein LtrA